MTSAGPGLQAALIAFSLRFRGVVIALAALVIAAGAYSLGHATYDVFPEFAPPQAVIHTGAPGLSPDQVEVLVTQPLENALTGAPGLASLRSSSIQGLSIITANFDPASDVLRDRQVVSERLASSVGLLPRQAQAPSLTPLTSSTSTVLVAGLTSSRASLMDLRTSAEWLIKPTLMAVPGVAKVAIFGSGMRSLQVQVNPDRLVRLNFGLNDVTEAAARAAGVRGAGFIDSANQRLELKTEYPPLGVDDLKRAVLGSDSTPFATLGDVATVLVAPAPATGGATIDGRPGVQLVVSQQYGASTVEVTRRIQAALDGLRPLLARDGVELDATLFRPADFIDLATGNVWSALLLGAALVVAVLVLFMADWRNAAVSCAAIPLSLLATLRLLQAFGVSVNTMTLGGLAVAIGVVVDDAVIDVENILRRMRANRLLAQPRSTASVILDACLEVRSGVVYATFAVVLVVLPIVSLSGVAGRLFAPLGYAYALAIIASLLVSLTVIPALSSLLFRPERMRAGEPPVLRWCRTRYERMLARVTRHPWPVMAAALLLTALGAAAAAGFGVNFIPELKEGHLIVHMSAAPGTSIEESMRLGSRVSSALHELTAVRAVGQRIGRADKSDDILGSHYSEFDVDLKRASGAQLEAAQSAIRSVLTQFPGVNFAMQSFLTERIEETLSGYTAAVAVNVIGPDLDALDRAAREIARTLHRIRGRRAAAGAAGHAAVVDQADSGRAAALGLAPARRAGPDRHCLRRSRGRAELRGQPDGERDRRAGSGVPQCGYADRRAAAAYARRPLRAAGSNRRDPPVRRPLRGAAPGRPEDADGDRQRAWTRCRRLCRRVATAGRCGEAAVRNAPRIRRRGPGTGTLAARPARLFSGGRAGYRIVDLDHRAQRAQPGDCAGEPAVRIRRGRCRGGGHRRRAVAGLDGGPGCAVRDHAAKLDPDRRPLRPAGAYRGAALGPGARN